MHFWISEISENSYQNPNILIDSIICAKSVILLQKEHLTWEHKKILWRDWLWTATLSAKWGADLSRLNALYHHCFLGKDKKYNCKSQIKSAPFFAELYQTHKAVYRVADNRKYAKNIWPSIWKSLIWTTQTKKCWQVLSTALRAVKP